MSYWKFLSPYLHLEMVNGNQVSLPSGIKLPLGQPWGRFGAPKIDSQRFQNNAWPAAATYHERGLVKMRES